MPRTTKALKKNVESLTSTTKSRKQSTTSSKKRTQITKGKTTLKTTTTQRAKVGTSKAKSSTAIKIIQSRKKEMFPMMNMYKYPYHFEPMPEIADRLNKAWFDEHFGEERMKDHIRKHKLKSHQYKAYVNYWWLQDKKNRGLS